MEEKENLLMFDNDGYQLSMQRFGARFMIDLEDNTYAINNKFEIAQFPFEAEGNLSDVLEYCDEQTKDIYELLKATHVCLEESHRVTCETTFGARTLIQLKTKKGSYMPTSMVFYYEFDEEKQKFTTMYGAIGRCRSAIPQTAEECITILCGTEKTARSVETSVG